MLPNLCSSCNKFLGRLVSSGVPGIIVDNLKNLSDSSSKCVGCDKVLEVRQKAQQVFEGSVCQPVDLSEKGSSTILASSQYDVDSALKSDVGLGMSSCQPEGNETLRNSSISSVTTVDEGTVVSHKRPITELINFRKLRPKKLKPSELPNSRKEREQLNPGPNVQIINCDESEVESGQNRFNFAKSLFERKSGNLHDRVNQLIPTSEFPRHSQIPVASVCIQPAEIKDSDGNGQIDEAREEVSNLVIDLDENNELQAESAESSVPNTVDLLSDMEQLMMADALIDDDLTIDEFERDIRARVATVKCYGTPRISSYSTSQIEDHFLRREAVMLHGISETKLHPVTLDVMAEEKERMRRIEEQEKFYQQIIPEITQNSNESRLILDINVKTKEVRVEVDNKLVKELKPHQHEGIKFMYNSIIENVDKIKGSGSGCMLSHGHGSGKSLQVISLIHTLLTNQHTKDHIRRVLITAPSHTLSNWVDEFIKWTRKKELKNFQVQVILSECEINAHFDHLNKWNENGGVFIIAPTLLTKFMMKNTRTCGSSDLVKKLFIYPGPDLLVVDEAHLLDDCKKLTYLSIEKIMTKRKILMTGTPLQNKLADYYYLIELIKPRLLGLVDEFVRRFEYPIENHRDKCVRVDMQLVIQQAHRLNSLTSGSIQRFNRLELYLPPKYEFVISIRPSLRILLMYNFYLDNVSRGNLLHDYLILLRCINHPYMLPARFDNSTKSSGTSSAQKWYTKFVQPNDWMEPELSGKFMILFKILESCVKAGEKLIVVSQYKETLRLIGKILDLKFDWQMNSDYACIIRNFNRNGGSIHEFLKHESCKLILFLTRIFAVDLTLANRIIMFDVSWNPTDDKRAISCIYRLGQTKPVYVYNFVTTSTVEEAVFRKHTEKLDIMGLILDKKQESTELTSSGQSYYRKFRPKCHYNPRKFKIQNDSLLATALNREHEFVLNCVDRNSSFEEMFGGLSAQKSNYEDSEKTIGMNSFHDETSILEIENVGANASSKDGKSLNNVTSTHDVESIKDLVNEPATAQKVIFHFPKSSSDMVDSAINPMGSRTNKLDVSDISFNFILVVHATATGGGILDFPTTKMLLVGLINKSLTGRTFSIHEGFSCTMVLTPDQQTRLDIKNTLECAILRYDNQMDYEFRAQIMELKNPRISFYLSEEVPEEKRLDWINTVTKFNCWPECSTINFESLLSKGDKFKCTLEISSNVRTKILKSGERILIDNQSVQFVDDIGIVFCYSCLTYNKCECAKLPKTCPCRCCYCTSYHINPCPMKNRPDRWFCRICKVHGHSTISTNCPIFMTKLQPELSKINHKYKYILLEQYDHSGGFSMNAIGRLFGPNINND